MPLPQGQGDDCLGGSCAIAALSRDRLASGKPVHRTNAARHFVAERLRPSLRAQRTKVRLYCGPQGYILPKGATRLRCLPADRAGLRSAVRVPTVPMTVRQCAKRLRAMRRRRGKRSQDRPRKRDCRPWDRRLRQTGFRYLPRPSSRAGARSRYPHRLCRVGRPGGSAGMQ